MKRIHRSATLALLVASVALPAQVLADEELVTLMTAIQTHTHKLQLSLDHDNAELAAFYAHEVEELVEEISEISEYDGYPVGQLAGAMLQPIIDRLGDALSSGGGTAAANRELDTLVNACNACHIATDHGYIVIARNSANPYLQSFEPAAR
jgi:hypothetical protein